MWELLLMLATGLLFDNLEINRVLEGSSNKLLISPVVYKCM